MKRTKLPKVKKRRQKTPLQKAETKLWDLCKAIIRKKYPAKCFTCPQSGLIGSNWHTGHYYPKGALGATHKYDLRVLRPQCYNCNINYGGMGAVFRENLAREIGREAEQKLYDECSASKGKTIKAIDHYLKLIGDYQKILEEMR